MKKVYEENYNSPALAEIWGEFIDWRKRRKGEKGFLTKVLDENHCRKIMDASLGDGCDSIFLLRQGFDVTSNEVDSLFIEKALSNARKNGVKLSITNFDWRVFGKKFREESFDAVILLGNSLTYLFSGKERVKTLSAFKNMLTSGGVLLIDERNYWYMLDRRKEILGGKFKYSGKAVYCGKKVHARPVEIQENKITMRYTHENGLQGFLKLYPFKKDELFQELRQSGFDEITRYSDYAKGFDANADFFQYVAIKP